MRSRINLPIILACFFLSGAAGLIYQVVWTKALGLIFGHTVYAIATVLATFMGGLAAGSAILGKWGGRQKRPIAVYGWLELLIAATAAFSLIGLGGVRALYTMTYHLVAGWLPVLIIVRVVASALILFLPTFLMGGTLPILTRGLTRSSSELGTQLSRLYWINTAGAVTGTLAAGFLLLPGVGLRWTLVVGIGLNVVAGGLALLMSVFAERSASVTQEEEAVATIPKTPRFLIIAFALVGATAMAYEIAWSRLLATMLGSSTYAFTTMLATFLAGIVIGSCLFQVWISRGHTISIATFAATQTLTGLGALIFIIAFRWLPALPLALIRATNMTFGGVILAQFLTSALAMLPAAIVFGFNFPVVVMLISRQEEAATSQAALVGRACAANTVGAILGALAAGFWLLPGLGSFRLVGMIVTANLALAFFLQIKCIPRRATELFGNAALAGIVFATAWFGLLYDPQIANFSVITAINLPKTFPAQLRLDELIHRHELLFAEDGLNASIEVLRAGNNLSLSTNGKIDASTGDAPTQLMVGHLGAIFHPGPKRVLIIGFGSGMTVSAVARYPEVQQIDCVEIEPAVLHAYPYLAPLNRGVLKDPRLHLIQDDARNFLFATQNRYDLIISQPSNPWIAGIATLFTQEFYQQVRARLEPGGLFVQWVQGYTVFPQEVNMVLDTVAREFPQVTLWAGRVGDYIVLAQSQARRLRLDHMQRLQSIPALQEDYQRLQLHSPEALIAYFRLDDGDLRAMAAGAQRNTDDHTRLEYRAPRALLSRSASEQNQQMIARQRSHLLPASVAVEDERRTLIAATQTLLNTGNLEVAESFVTALGKGSPTAETELLRGQWFGGTGKLDEARKACETARKLDPSSPAILLQLATVARFQKDFRAAEGYLRQLLQLRPSFLPAYRAYALLETDEGNFSQALEWQIKRVQQDPAPQSRDLSLLGMLFVRVGDLPKAENIYRASLSLDGYDFESRLALGEIYLRQQRWEEARKQLEFVILNFNPIKPEPYVDLAQAYSNLGLRRVAASTLDQGRRLFPDSPLVQAAILH